MRLSVYGIALGVLLLAFTLPAYPQAGPQGLYFPNGGTSFSGTVTNFNAGPGRISITGNTGNGTDQINNLCINGVNGTICPLTAFGAKCDGTTDDSAALNNAYATIMARGGGEIDIPGKCAVNQVVLGGTTAGALRIRGISAYAGLIKVSGGTPGSILSSNNPNLSSLRIEGLTFDCNASMAGSSASFQSCVGGFDHGGTFEFDNNTVRNWNGYNGVQNLYHTTSATYLNNRFESMLTGPNQYATETITGSISGTTLTVTAVSSGASGSSQLNVGQGITGLGISANTVITGVTTAFVPPVPGPEVNGVYTVNNSQTVASESMVASNGAMDISSQSVVTMVQGNKCLSGGKCVFVDEWPSNSSAFVSITGNISNCPTGYAVGNSDITGNATIPAVYGTVSDNIQVGSGSFDSAIIIGGDYVAGVGKPPGQTYMTVANNVINGIIGANNVGIQLNYTAYVTVSGNTITGASDQGTYAYYCNTCLYSSFYAGSTSNVLAIVGTANGTGLSPPTNARGTDTFMAGIGYFPDAGTGFIGDGAQLFLNGNQFAGGREIYPATIALTGTATAGSATCSQSEQGTLKIVTCYLNGYQNTGSAQVGYYNINFSTIPTVLEGGATGNTCGAYHAGSATNYVQLPANAAMTPETCNITMIGQ